MSTDHSHDADETAAPHDLAAEAEHARQHAVENNWFFLTFFSVVALAVLSYELTANNRWEIGILAGLRCVLIAVFLFSLVKRFNFVVASLVFTVLFFIFMIFLSMWGSFLPTIGDPIVLPHVSTHH